ncbi:MAG: protein kinase [Pirellulales bacterium]
MATMHYRPGIEAVPGYKLIELLGRGGFGEVWRAQGPGGVILAVKIIDKVDDKAGRKEFRALKLIRNLRHPNLVSISGFWLRDAEGNLLDPETLTDEPQENATHPSELIVAMDLGEMSLLERLDECRKGIAPDAKGGIPFEELIEYMDAAARAIDYLNVRHDIQHRDVKPQNILIVGGSAQVCDFGLASAVSSVRTSMGGAGSLAYMAPEIYTSKRPSRATDQYGLAVAYVELRTGRLPLADTESYAVLDEAKRLGKLDLSWLDEAEQKVIAKATQVNADDRYGRCVDLVQALRSAAFPTSVVNPTTTDTLKPIGDYQPQRQIYRRAGEEIWEAISPERHHVTLVVRDVSESPTLATSPALALSREVSKRHPRLAEMYEYCRLSETGKVAPARLFESPNPPGFARLLLAGKLCSGNMNDRMTSGGLTAGQLLDEMEQLAEAVDFLNAPTHDSGGKKVRIMHLNVRPANFQFDGGNVLLGNFSSAQLIEGDEQPFPAGRAMADNAYNAPEFTDEKLTRWSDQYQLAVAYLQMRTGKPSSGLTSSHGGTRRTTGASRLDLEDLQSREQDAIARATATQPSERFDTCAELAAELRKAWAEDRALSGLSDEPPTATVQSGGNATMLPDNRTIVAPLGDASAAVAVGSRAVQGTLAAPRYAETSLESDTDPEAGRRLAAATAQPAAQPSILVPPPARRGAPWLTVGLAAALFGVIAWGGYNYFLSPQSKLGSAINSRIADGNFLEALDDIEHTGEELTDEQRNELRIQVRLAWFSQNVVPLEADRKYVAALDALAQVDAKLAEAEQVQHWEAEVVERWYKYAKALGNKENGEPIRSALEFNALIRRRGGYEESVRLRGDAIDNAIKSSLSKLVDKPEDTYTTASEAIRAIDEAKPISILSQEEELARRRRALIARARAAGRLSQWESVKTDLKELGAQFATREESAIGTLLGLLADARQAAAVERLEQARQLLQTSAAVLDPWEKQKLDDLIKTLDNVVGGRRFEQFQKQLTEAENLGYGGNYGEASAALARIRDDKSFAEFIRGKELARVDALAAVCVLGRADSKSEDVATAAANVQNLISQNAVAEQRVASVCDLLRRRALEKTSTADATRKSPQLLAVALPTVAKAKSRVKVGSPEEKQLQEILRSLVAELQVDLRRQRDVAGTAAAAALKKQWESLAAQAKIAEELGATDRLTAVIRIEAAIESGSGDVNFADAVKKLALPSNAKPTPDDRYVNYVLARAAAAGRSSDAPTALAAAWNGQSPAADAKPIAEETWQLSPARRRAAVDLLVGAAQNKARKIHDPSLGADPAQGDRFATADAAAVYPQLALAQYLAAKAGFDPKRSADAGTLRTLGENLALAAAYNPATADAGVQLTNDLIDAAADDGVSTQVYVANLRLIGERLAKSPQPADRIRFVRAAGRLLALCEAKYFDVRSATLFDRVIAPGFEQAVAIGDALPDADKVEAARLAAARGRYIRSIGAIEERFAQAQGGPDQVAYDSYDKAVAFDATESDYYVGRGMAYQDLLQPTPDKKAAVLRENAKLADEHAENDDQRNIALGLNALALYQESNWVPDYDAKREKLTEAVAELAKVNSAGAKAAGASGQIYHALRVVEGGGYLHLANYAGESKDKAAYLDRAKEVARSIVEGDENRVHPEWALLLWGNTEEDEGMFLDKLDSYESALSHFTKALEASQEDGDPKGQSSALLGRGRCRYRQAIDASKDDAEIRRRLTQALADLNDSIAVAGAWPLQQAEAHRWIGTIYQHPLVAETAKATENFDRAAELAKDSNPSWPIYEIARANHALRLAESLIDPDNLRRPTPQAEKLLFQARAAAQVLLDDETDARIDGRHRAQTALIVAQSHIWEGAPQKASETLDTFLKRLKGDDAFSLAYGVAKSVLDLPGGDRDKRKLTPEETGLSQHVLDAALATAKGEPIAKKTELFELNRAYYNLWNPQFQASAKRVAAEPAVRRSMLDLLHHVRFHLAVGVKLQSDPEWKAAGGKIEPELKQSLVEYTKFLLSPGGETDWNKPGRDQARYKADAGL